MKMLGPVLIACLAATFFTATVHAQGTAAAQKSTTTGNAVRGKQLYLEFSCYACHGYNAQTGNGQRLLPPRLTEQVFKLYIRAPRTPQMPAYSTKLISDAEAADIYAYILSLPREPDLKDVPLLNQLPK
jgi:mono/diheme cytochrome c family protein